MGQLFISPWLLFEGGNYLCLGTFPEEWLIFENEGSKMVSDHENTVGPTTSAICGPNYIATCTSYDGLEGSNCSLCSAHVDCTGGTIHVHTHHHAHTLLNHTKFYE